MINNKYLERFAFFFFSQEEEQEIHVAAGYTLNESKYFDAKMGLGSIYLDELRSGIADILTQNHWANLVFVEVFLSRSIYGLCHKLNMFFFSSSSFPSLVMLCYFSSKGSTDIKPRTSFNLPVQTFGRACVCTCSWLCFCQ